MPRGGRGGAGRSSGGGRRSGGGRGRVSGGRMGSASSSRGGYTGRGGYSSSAHSRRTTRGGGGFGGGPGYVPPPRRRRGRRSAGGCLGPSAFSILLVLIVIIAAVTITVGASSGHNSSIGKSTVKREPLDAAAVTMTNYYTDELGWIDRESVLIGGMEAFYKQTGVQPYLYITGTVNGTHTPTSDDMDAYANKLYDQLFEDEAHILILFHEYNPTEYSTWYVSGNQAKIVMDDEACGILLDYIDAYYPSDMSDEEMFATAFEKAADRIMTVTRSPVPFVLIAICVVLVLFIAFYWWKKAKKQKNLEAEQTRRILDADLHTFGQADPELSDLENKYK